MGSMVRLLFILLLPTAVFAQKVRQFTGAVGALPGYTPVTIHDEREAFNTSTGEFWQYQSAWYNTTKLGTATLYSVKNASEISTKSYALGSTIKVVENGAEYRVQSAAPTGYAADGVVVVSTSGRFAVLQPVAGGYSAKHVGGQVQKLLNFLSVAVPSTAGVVLADTSLVFTDSLLLRENTQIRGVAPLGDFGTHPLDTPGKVIWSFDINNPNKNCIVFEDTGRGYVMQTGLKDLQIKVVSPARSAVRVTKPYGKPIDNVRINADATLRYLKYGVTYCCAVITEMSDLYTVGTSVAALYQEPGAFGSTSTIFNNCYFTRSKIAVWLNNAEPFFNNCVLENIDSIGFYLENGSNLKFQLGGWENTPLGPNGYFARGVGPSNQINVSNISYGGAGAGGNATFSAVPGKTIASSLNLFSYATLIQAGKIGIWENVINYNSQSWNSLKNRYNYLSHCTYLTGDATSYDWEPYALIDSVLMTRAYVSASEFQGYVSMAEMVGSVLGGSQFAEATEDFTAALKWVLNSNAGFNGTITRTANASNAPNLELTADRIEKTNSTLSRIFPAGSEVLAQYDSLDLGQRYTYSVWAKKPVGSDIKLRLGGFSASDTIDVPADGNWYRISHTATCYNKSNANALYFLDIIGTAGNYIDLWGYMMNPGALDAYIPNATSSVHHFKSSLK